MSIWSLLNYAAWGFSALLTIMMATDFMAVEAARKKESLPDENQAENGDTHA